MNAWKQMRTAWLKARIDYHRRQANAYSRTPVRYVGPDRYASWARSRALRHSMKAHDLERKLLLSGMPL